MDRSLLLGLLTVCSVDVVSGSVVVAVADGFVAGAVEVVADAGVDVVGVGVVACRSALGVAGGAAASASQLMSRLESVSRSVVIVESAAASATFEGMSGKISGMSLSSSCLLLLLLAGCRHHPGLAASSNSGSPTL